VLKLRVRKICSMVCRMNTCMNKTYQILTLSLMLGAAATRISFASEPLLHLDLESNGYEYRKYLRSHNIKIETPNASDPVSLAVRAGERNLAWLDRINAARDPSDPVRLTNPQNRHGHSITEPHLYSDQTVATDFQKLQSELPASMTTIIFDGRDQQNNQIPSGISKEDFIVASRKVDRLYQTATRWTMLIPYRWQLEARKAEDIRGYYFLNLESDLENKLVNFANLSAADQTRIGDYLKGECLNATSSESGCQRSFNQATASRHVLEYYKNYNANAKEVYDDNFRIRGVRGDITWTSANPNLAQIPMQPTNNSAINDFLKTNIEDEWKFNGWHLQLDFNPSSVIEVVFEPGALPHVNGIGGNQITMDANASINEYEVQWTIRHEFGHVLGFTDCYVEFYDRALAGIVNYQIDVTNLMCSRAGNFKETHYQEMKRAYYKN
jgi:hypothetical protein